MRMVDDDEIVSARQLFDREGFEILQRALVPFDGDAGLLFPQCRAGDHRIVTARMAPGHAAQCHVAHRPNSARIAALCSPIRGAARSTLALTPSTRSGELVVRIETSSSRVTV